MHRGSARRLAVFAGVAVWVISGAAFGQAVCDISLRHEFRPQHKTVGLISRGAGNPAARFVLFQSKLRVNTDGAPNSYHPDDLSGSVKAINNIANAVAVSRNGKTVGYNETLRVFAQFRDAHWVVPNGNSINWRNVLASRVEGGHTVPCVFGSGPFKGYFGSLTALKNGLPADTAGECDAGNQLDERVVPALVIAGGANPLRDFGVAIGDLVVAVNPANGATTAAVVGDTGPADNLGEGSVALNMALLGRTQQPKTYAEAKTLDTGGQEIVVAMMPGSAMYKRERPYTAQNIDARVKAWLSERGYGSLADFAALLRSCGPRL